MTLAWWHTQRERKELICIPISLWEVVCITFSTLKYARSRSQRVICVLILAGPWMNMTVLLIVLNNSLVLSSQDLASLHQDSPKFTGNSLHQNWLPNDSINAGLNTSFPQIIVCTRSHSNDQRPVSASILANPSGDFQAV